MLSDKEWKELDKRLLAYDRKHNQYQNRQININKDKQYNRQANIIINNFKLFL